MSKFYSQVALVLHLRKQAEVFNELAGLFEKIKPAIIKLDGKVINVKLERAIRELLPSTCYPSLLDNYNHQKKVIRITTHNNDYTGEKGHHSIISDSSHEIEFTDGRLNAGEVIAEIDNAIVSLHAKALSLNNDCDHMNEIVAEYKEICSLIKAFKSKINWRTSKEYDFANI